MEHLIGEKVESLVCRLHAVTKLHLGKVNICFLGSIFGMFIFLSLKLRSYVKMFINLIKYLPIMYNFMLSLLQLTPI